MKVFMFSLMFLLYVATGESKPVPGVISITVLKRSKRQSEDIIENPQMAKFSQLTSVWSNCRQMRLFCKTGLYAAVNDLGEIEGVSQKDMEQGADGTFQLESYGTSMVRIFHVSSKKYIAMNNKGDVVMEKEKSDESLFYVHQEENSYETYASIKYFIGGMYDMFLSLNKYGRTRSGRNTFAGHKSAQWVTADEKNPKSCVR